LPRGIDCGFRSARDSKRDPHDQSLSDTNVIADSFLELLEENMLVLAATN
jgi:hypothetical protein